jgi:hypothetical protein
VFFWEKNPTQNPHESPPGHAGSAPWAAAPRGAGDCTLDHQIKTMGFV